MLPLNRRRSNPVPTSTKFSISSKITTLPHNQPSAPHALAPNSRQKASRFPIKIPRKLNPMSTAAQRAANKANSQLSSGPKTAAGKAASSKNNQIHRLTMVGGSFQWPAREDFDAFKKIVVDLRAEHQPTTVTENMLVERLAQHFWLRRRALELQETCFEGAGEIGNEKLFTLYLRYQTTHERGFQKALNDLLKLRAEKRKQEIGFASQKRLQETHDWKKERHNMTAQSRADARLIATLDDFEDEGQQRAAARGLIDKICSKLSPVEDAEAA
jgi:hypothetical protein